MLFSSVSAKELMFGKIIGHGVLGFSQIIIWATDALIVGINFFNISVEGLFTIKTLYMFIYFILGFILVSGLNAIAGALTKDGQPGGQSTSNFIGLVAIVPIWLSGVLTRLFTYIPFFTSSTMLIRLGVSSPSLLEMGITVLLYGKSFSLGEILKWAGR